MAWCCSKEEENRMKLFSPSLGKLWNEWNLRVTVLLSLTLQIVMIVLDIFATFSLGIISNNISDIYDQEGGSVDANTELTAFWAPFLLLHLGGPDTITAYSLEDNELWLRHLLGLVAQTGMAIYVFLMAWTGSHLSILSLLMFFAGLIKYGERTWVLRKASAGEIRESYVEVDFDRGQFLKPGDCNPYGHNLYRAYLLMNFSFQSLFLDFKLSNRAVIRGSYLENSLGDGFQVIEMALGFMYDFLYTKAPHLYTQRGLCLRVITFFLTSTVLVLFPFLIHKDKFSKTDFIITLILLFGAIILEIYSALLLLFSDRFLVWLMIREKVSTAKAFESFQPQMRWSNNMSQLSLLSFIMKEKPLPFTDMLEFLRVDKKLEQKWYADDMEIHNNLKKIIFQYLKEKAAGAGTALSESHRIHTVDGPNFTQELEKSILAWHVATDIWYELDREALKRQGPAMELHCELICQISRYMFYLLVLHPKMVSDGSMIQISLQLILSAARHISFESKTQACQNFKDLLDQTKSTMLLQVWGLVGFNNDINDFLGVDLPDFLRKTLEERWKIISWSWLEMLPYAAWKCKGDQHALQLKRGGEFLTHVSLLTVLFGFTHKDFTSHPPAPLFFNSVMPLLQSLKEERTTRWKLFSQSSRKLWKEWNLRVTVLLSLTLQITLIVLGNRRKYTHKLWISIAVWCVYLFADIVATFGLGIISKSFLDVYDHEEGGSMDAPTELTAFWAPFLLLHLGGPDTITAYALEDSELWLRHFLGLVVQTGMTIYVCLLAWTGSFLSMFSLLMFFAGLIKYGERTWVLRKASRDKITESFVLADINDKHLYLSVHDDGIRYGHNLHRAYYLLYVSSQPPFLDLKFSEIMMNQGISLEDTFQAIEMALGFMNDYLYTKSPLLYTRWGLVLRVITFIFTFSVLVLFPVVVYIHDKHKFSITDLTITFILLVGSIVLEIYSALLVFSSDQFLVWLIARRKYSTEKALESFLPQKRWSNNMSQLSLLSFIIQEKPLPFIDILKLLSFDKKLEKKWYAYDMEIPKNLKKLIFHYLKEKAGAGTAPSEIHVVDGQDFTQELEKSILVWHSATDIWYELDREDLKRQGLAVELHCELIYQISRYMFYLLVLHPNMVSDGSMNQITLQSILSPARKVSFASKTEACQNLKDLLEQTEFNDHFLDNDLPEFLRKLSEHTLEERWKRISWSWLEMLPYAAWKCKGDQHAKQLKRGGEFLTHVSLLTVLFGFNYKDFTAHPAGPLFNSLMPLLQRPDLFGINENDISSEI
ncbi:hypothetical protein Dsin_014089 [Dipteronia sinensis]|uniref:DUF4220 domain-containing protein n=1 Tax=Dipteronia sinensis TaxID=43782 RepID=A0AAE0E9Q3_9ROSI|nr:hypothetical protein Dsin_014089 [Dipteronia sinensis]